MSNAGITRDGLVLRMKDDDFTDVLDANLTAAFGWRKRAVKGMMKGRWGRIVFVSSIVGAAGQAGQANYAASKAGLVGLARSLAKEFASRNITVNVVAPGPIATDMLDALPEERAPGHGRRPSRSAGSVPPTRWPASSASSRRTPRHSSPARWSPSTAAWRWEFDGLDCRPRRDS